MSSRSEISFNFELANKKAQELDEVADRMVVLVNRQDEAIESLRSSWNSDNSPKYIAKAMQNRDIYNDQIQKIRGAASYVRARAQAIYEAEMRAIEIAEKREREAAEAAAKSAAGSAQ